MRRYGRTAKILTLPPFSRIAHPFHVFRHFRAVFFPCNSPLRSASERVDNVLTIRPVGVSLRGVLVAWQLPGRRLVVARNEAS